MIPQRNGRDCPLVMISWLDSRQPNPAWWRISDLNDSPMPVECATVGWLVHDGSDCKVVCQSVADLTTDDAQVGGVMTIPSRAVLRIDVLTTERSDDDPSKTLA